MRARATPMEAPHPIPSCHTAMIELKRGSKLDKKNQKKEVAITPDYPVVMSCRPEGMEGITPAPEIILHIVSWGPSYLVQA